MKTFLLVLFSLTILALHAQKVTGVVKDAEGTPVAGATVSLLKAADSAVVKLAVTTTTGVYDFADVKHGNYRVKISHISFVPVISPAFTVATENINAPVMNLKKATGEIKGVVVTATQPLIEVKADRTIMNVEGTMNATGTDALELLRRSPGVTVDKDDNLTLAGKNGVQVYVDNRPSPLSGQDLATFLKSLQSSQVESIEIITNPSAKYEAAGNAGIINIRLKKNKSFGTNGSVNAGWAIGTYAKYNGGINLNHRNKKINAYGTYSVNKSKNNNDITFNRSLLDSLFDQKGVFVFNQQSHNFKVGLDYTIDKSSSIGAIVTGTLASPDLNTSNKTLISYVPAKTVDRILSASNNSQMNRDNYNINLNYNYTGKAGKSLVVNADKGYYSLDNIQYQPNIYYDATGKTAISSVIYEMQSPTKINIHSVKADYEQDFKKGKLGFGGKTAFITTDNDFQRYNVLPTGKDLDKDRSNRFEYTENINAGYVNYNRGFKGFMVQAGLRVENTVSEGTSNGLKKEGGSYLNATTGFKRNYTNLFPSAAVTFNKNPMNQWSFTYSRRIDRPNYQDLNPFEFKLDEYTTMKGNTELRPQYTNSFGVTNTYKYKLTTTLNYSHVSDLFTQIIDTIDRSKAFNSKRNLASQDITSLNVSYPFMYKNLMIFGNLNAFYSMYKADFGNNRKINLNAFGLSFVTQSSLKLDKAKLWTAELTSFYNAPTIYQGTFKAKSLWSIDAGLSKQVMKGKGTMKVAVTDVFRSLRFSGTSDFAGQKTNVTARWESQQLKLNFIYRFGSNLVKAAKQKSSGAEEELKRVQQDSGGIGIGK